MLDAQHPAEYQAPQSLLKNKIILVTGAGDGIGKAASKAFAQHGATVVLLGRTLSKLEAVYDEIEAAGGPQPAIVPMNFESAVEQDYIETIKVLESEFGRLDGLLHNASQLGPRTPIANYPLGEWQKLFQVNVTAPFSLTQAVLPLLRNGGSASVIFTSSAVGNQGRAYWGAYAASKAAAENLMQTLADEYEGMGNIRFNSINPGATRTRMRASAYPAEDPTQLKTPDEILNAYLFLMGDESIGVSGRQFDAQVTEE